MSNYKRITMIERLYIEDSLNNHKSGRRIAEELNRSNSTICVEIKNNKVFAKGPNKGQRCNIKPETLQGKICPKLLKFPYVCNGCNQRNYNCSRPIKIEYLGVAANELSTNTLSETRKGVNIDAKSFNKIGSILKLDLAKGLSPYSISCSHPEISVSPSTLYRWIMKGHFNLTRFDLPKEVKYKPRKKHKIIPTKHGQERSYNALFEAGEDIFGNICQMDTVIGRKYDNKCLLTLYLTNCKFQFIMLLDNKTCEKVTAALNALELYLGYRDFTKLFGTLLTDNGTEFSDYPSLEGSYTVKNKSRCKVYYCDVRASNQKAGCEKNHVEIRKILPKRRGIDFDKLDQFDIAYINSQINSFPRKSLNGLTPIALFKAIYGKLSDKILPFLGIEELSPSDLNLTLEGINYDRNKRGLCALNS